MIHQIRNFWCLLLYRYGRCLLGVWAVILIASHPVYAEGTDISVENFAVAYSARVVGDSNRTRVFIDFDRDIRFKTMYLENPDRVVLDFKETIFGFSRRKRERIKGLIKDFRYGSIAPGRSRIVLLTNAPAQVEKFSIDPVESNQRFRLKLDLVKIDRESYRSALFLQKSQLGKSGGVAYKGDRIKRTKAGKPRLFTVVIDPGHGGIDGGAEGYRKSAEKTVTLGFGLALKKVLEENPDVKVLMTRENDVFVSLAERVNFARRNKADLMLSIHADSLRQREVRGATVYTLSAEGSDEISRNIAESENRADIFAGLDVPDASSDVADILIDLTRRETKLFSVQFASALVTKLHGKIPLIKNPRRSANFRVLRAPEVPSVLLELGYLSNEKDVQQLFSAKWQGETARHIADAIVSFKRIHEIRNR